MTFYELCQKEVVSITSGVNMGKIDDAVFETDSATVSHLVLYGRLKLFGILGREEDMVVAWSDIEKIGVDVILVHTPVEPATKIHSIGENVKRWFS